jgi:hypothetical protein
MGDLTPEQFDYEVDRLIKEYKKDPEALHSCLDSLMEDVLWDLGYFKGVKKIKSCTRWCA